jgi:hypothetical protein
MERSVDVVLDDQLASQLILAAYAIDRTDLAKKYIDLASAQGNGKERLELT